jgi:hypothetical protein
MFSPIKRKSKAERVEEFMKIRNELSNPLLLKCAGTDMFRVRVTGLHSLASTSMFAFAPVQRSTTTAAGTSRCATPDTRYRHTHRSDKFTTPTPLAEVTGVFGVARLQFPFTTFMCAILIYATHVSN